MNIQQMMKQAQNMQKKMQENQTKLERMEFDGVSANGSIKIKIIGTGLVKAVSIEKSLVDPNDVEILEDLLVVAFNNATDQFNKAKESLMSDATGGVKLPF